MVIVRTMILALPEIPDVPVNLIEYYRSNRPLEVDERGPWIETFTGKRMHLADPTADEVCLEDIVQSLAHVNRYNGHTGKPFSVLQHLILCDAVWNVLTTKLQGGYLAVNLLSTVVRPYLLLHDAHEAYTGDITSPAKALPECTEFKNVEKRLDRVIYEHFRLPEPTNAVQQWVKFVDLLVLGTEHSSIFTARHQMWNLPYNPMEDAEVVAELDGLQCCGLGTQRRTYSHALTQALADVQKVAGL